jgi:hypothetical protein
MSSSCDKSGICLSVHILQLCPFKRPYIYLYSSIHALLRIFISSEAIVQASALGIRKINPVNINKKLLLSVRITVNTTCIQLSYLHTQNYVKCVICQPSLSGNKKYSVYNTTALIYSDIIFIPN